MHDATDIDPWFLDQISLINEIADEVRAEPELGEALLRDAKRHGFSDVQLAKFRRTTEAAIRRERVKAGVVPVYKTVDTCAAEFEARTPYHYSTYDEESEVAPRDKSAVLILGSGPNRIGQGIEFDYSCVHAALALRDAGYETVMVNCNPETVSTDYDTSDRLYFEPLTAEDVLAVYEAELAGSHCRVICQLGGQTPLGLAQTLKDAGVPVVGTSPEAIHLAEERGALAGFSPRRLCLHRRMGSRAASAKRKRLPTASAIQCWSGLPYVLGGVGWRSCTTSRCWLTTLSALPRRAPSTQSWSTAFLTMRSRSTLMLCSTAPELFLGGVMGAHRGSRCAFRRLGLCPPPITLSRTEIQRVRRSTEAIARGVGVRGLLNVQYALAGESSTSWRRIREHRERFRLFRKRLASHLRRQLRVLRLGRQSPSFAVRGILTAHGDGGTLPVGGPVAVKEAVLPFGRFHGVDTLLGPEMRSTGEVMGIDHDFGTAFAKSQSAAFSAGLPTSGRVFVSMADRDKRSMVFPRQTPRRPRI